MDKLVVKELNTFYNGKTVLITGSTGFIGREILTQIKGKDVSALCLYRKKKNNIKRQLVIMTRQ